MAGEESFAGVASSREDQRTLYPDATAFDLKILSTLPACRLGSSFNNTDNMKKALPPPRPPLIKCYCFIEGPALSQPPNTLNLPLAITGTRLWCWLDDHTASTPVDPMKALVILKLSNTSSLFIDIEDALLASVRNKQSHLATITLELVLFKEVRDMLPAVHAFHHSHLLQCLVPIPIYPPQDLEKRIELSLLHPEHVQDINPLSPIPTHWRDVSNDPSEGFIHLIITVKSEFLQIHMGLICYSWLQDNSVNHSEIHPQFAVRKHEVSAAVLLICV